MCKHIFVHFHTPLVGMGNLSYHDDGKSFHGNNVKRIFFSRFNAKKYNVAKTPMVSKRWNIEMVKS